jgi:hypothetical protein
MCFEALVSKGVLSLLSLIEVTAENIELDGGFLEGCAVVHSMQKHDVNVRIHVSREGQEISHIRRIGE